ALSDKITSVKTPDGLSSEDQINFSDLQTRARQIQNTWTSIIGANIVEDLKYNAINRPFLEAASQVLLFSILGGVYNEPIGSVYKESFSSKRLGSINEISLNEVKPFDASLGGTLGTKADIFAPNITKQLARIFRQNDAMILGESDEGLMASTRAPTYPTSNGPTGIGVSVKEPVTVIKNLNTKQIIIDTKEGMALTNILKAPEGTITRNLKTVPNVSANPNPITVSNIKVTPITAGIMGVAPVKATMPEYDHDHETPDMRPTKYIVVGGQAYYPDPLYPNRWRKLYETDPNELYIFDETGKRMILDINRVLRTYSDGSTRAKIERTDTDIVLTEYFSILPTRQGSNYREEKMKLSYSLDGNGNFELKQLTIQERQQSDTNPNIVAAWEAFKLEKDQKSGTFILFSQPSGKYEFRNHRYFNNIPAGMVQDFVNKWYTNIETVTASDVKKDLENILPDIEKNSIETGHNVVEPSGRTWHIDYDYTWAPKTNNSKTNNKIIPKKGNNSNINGPRNMLNQSVNAGLYPNIPEWTHPDKLQGEESSSERPGLPSLEENTGKVEAPGSNNGIINVQDITKKIITDDGSYEEVTTGVYKKIGSPYTTTYKYVDGKMIEQGDLLHKQEKLQGPDYQIYDFVPENKRIPNDKLDFGSVYDPDSYIQPNELHPENAKPIFDKINKGVYISVGSERGFISASMTGASDLLLIDKYGGVVLYNRIKIGLISISRSKEDLRYLILKASGDEWVKRVNEYEGPLASEVRDVLTDKRNFDFFQRELRDGDDVIMDLVSGTNNYIITDYNYHFNQILYNRLKSMTNEGRISAHLVDLTDTDLMRQIADNIKARGLTIGALDISNAWGSTYKGTNSLFINKNHEPNKHNNPFGDYDVKYFEKLLLSLSNSIDPKSVLILTGVRDKGIYSSYLAFYFTYLMDNISNLRTLPNTLFLMTNYSSFIDFLYQKHPETSPMLKTDMEKLNWNNNALINPDVFSLAKYFPAKPSLADKEKTKTKLKTKKEAGKDKADKKTLTPTQPSLEDEEKTKTKLKTKKGAGKGKADKKTLTPEDQDVEDLIKNNKISNKENKIFRAFYNKYDGPEDLSEL
ncbi:MAG: hypothetical protein NTY22_04575, partial [Proteobacteria bacterium]|nr:hypothetical protein [Pseudomonadota bacterium]